MAAIGRNEPCHCGSGLKYKRCCALKANRMPLGSRLGLAVLAVMLGAGAIFMLTSLGDRDGNSIAPARVWHIDHWDYPGQAH